MDKNVRKTRRLTYQKSLRRVSNTTFDSFKSGLKKVERFYQKYTKWDESWEKRMLRVGWVRIARNGAISNVFLLNLTQPEGWGEKFPKTSRPNFRAFKGDDCSWVNACCQG